MLEGLLVPPGSIGGKTSSSITLCASASLWGSFVAPAIVGTKTSGSMIFLSC